jgi:chromosome segregation ATPase
MAAESAHDAVPVSFEIRRLETLINDLDDVMREQQRKLIKQEVDIEYLEKDVENANERQAHLSAEVSAARDILAVHQDSYVIGQKSYDYHTVATEATGKAEALKRSRSIHEAKAQTLEALRNAVSQARHQLHQADTQRQQYAVRLNQLEATAENIAIRNQLISSLDTIPTTLDKGAFQQVEANFTRLERELAVQQRALNERYDSAPAPEKINFSAPEKQDVLGLLDEALDRTPEPQSDALALNP